MSSIKAVPRTALVALAVVGGANAQGSSQHGGHPPAEVETQLCSISTVFTKLSEIQADPDCRSGCAGGTGNCGQGDWMASGSDVCSASCGIVFEPFWDECGEMLTSSGMGGMAGMGEFYENCLTSLYPPGVCGMFCNDHTFECFMTEVHEACCDEGGTNCEAGRDVPYTCPVGCAFVFPEFMEICRNHVANQDDVDVNDFDAFEESCIDQDGLELVEYAMSLQAQGCTIDLDQGRRRTQKFVGQWLGSQYVTCEWDEIDDLANEIDQICGGLQVGGECSPTCAIAMHQFTTDCGAALDMIIPMSDPRRTTITEFEESCMNGLDSHVILDAIALATCPPGVGPGASSLTPPPPGFFAPPDALFYEDFERNDAISDWHGQNDVPTPGTAIISQDDNPFYGHVLQTQGCSSGGDAFSVAMFECTLEEPCLIEYDHKGRMWQGFSSSYPGSHTWAATPTDYAGATVTTVHDTENWHHIEYLFPTADAEHHHQGDPDETTIDDLHFMLEGFDVDCDATFIDNILVTRATPERFCDAVDRDSFVSVCSGLEFHETIDMTEYVALPVCNVLVNTNGGNCNTYCESQGHVCRHAQDNINSECTLDENHERQDTSDNGCNQNWGNQICGCAQADDFFDTNGGQGDGR